VPSPSKEFSDLNLILGTAGQEPRVARGPGENAGADAHPPPPGPPAPPPLNVQGLPLIKPPYGTISAINLDRGEIAWRVPHGDTPDFVRNSEILKGLEIPKTGQAGSVGTLVTKTLVIAGDPQITTTSAHPRGAMLRAYDKSTGKEVGAVFMPAPQSGSPMTYMINGKQYIVVAVSGGPYSGEYLAFSLPTGK
jgi:quinoprotein glucose dehydrogenase